MGYMNTIVYYSVMEKKKICYYSNTDDMMLVR